MHLCLANFYAENFGYQENVLTKMHKKLGHEVTIVASTETYINKSKYGYVKPSKSINEDNIPVIRLPYVKWLPHFIAKKIRLYKGVKHEVYKADPDIIFVHGPQFLSILSLKTAAKKIQARVIVDSHADYMNSAKNWFSRLILHKLIYYYCVKSIESQAEIIWGVTPARKTFLEEFYHVAPEKTGLLVMGADDSNIDYSKRSFYRQKTRKRLLIPENEFLIISGGKMVKRKNIDHLINAFIQLNIPNTRLLLFGSIDDEIKDELSSLIHSSPKISFLGWQSTHEITQIMFASDLAIFPGAHSALWEHAAGIGIPCVFKSWKGYHHLNVGGNCEFLDKTEVEDIRNVLQGILGDSRRYKDLKRNAENKGPKVFSYSEIAKRSIQHIVK